MGEYLYGVKPPRHCYLPQTVNEAALSARLRMTKCPLNRWTVWVALAASESSIVKWEFSMHEVFGVVGGPRLQSITQLSARSGVLMVREIPNSRLTAGQNMNWSTSKTASRNDRNSDRA
jgi:hypothetical protein